MKGYVYGVLKNNKKFEGIDNIINKIDSLKECKHQFEYDITDNILSIVYTNEIIELQPKRSMYFFSYSGQLAKPYEQIKNDIEAYNPVVAKNYIKNLGGAFSIGFLHYPTKSIRVFTHFARVNPVYYYEDEHCIVIGTDPIIVQAVAYNQKPLSININQTTSFLVNGYYADNETVFRGVKAVPENTEVLIEDEKIKFNYIDTSIDSMFSKNPTKEDFDELTHIYLQAYDAIPQSKVPHRIGLTGGKDSRLIALGLLEKDIPFKATTRGFDDHPDVLIAQEIAQRLNIEHTINKPILNNANELEIDIIEKILNPMIGTSGNVFGYENIKYNPRYENRIGLTGVGAECVRGGYENHSKKSPTQIDDELIKSFFPLKQHFITGAEYKRFLIDFAENERAFKEAQCKHYIFYRVGRWAGGTRNSVLYTADMYSPFFDNQFLKKATQLNIDTLIGEEVHYNIMQRLNPEIAQMAFFGSRWGFEQKGPKNPNDYNKWLKRKPVYAKTQLGAYNWRMLNNQDTTLRNVMREILFSNPNDEIFEAVNFKRLEQIMKKPLNASVNKFIWGLASVKLYKDYLNGKEKQVQSLLRLQIPSNEIKTLSKQPNIQDITYLFKPINKAVHLQNLSNGIELNSGESGAGNLYIQTGDGPLVSPPTNQTNVLNVEGYKLAYLKIHLDSLEAIDYDVYVMLFDDSERISSELIKVRSSNKRVYVNKNIKITDQTRHLKIALKLKPKDDPWKVTLKYAYVELK